MFENFTTKITFKNKNKKFGCEKRVRNLFGRFWNKWAGIF